MTQKYTILLITIVKCIEMSDLVWLQGIKYRNDLRHLRGAVALPSDVAAVVRLSSALGSANPAVRELGVPQLCVIRFFGGGGRWLDCDAGVD